MEEAVKCKLCTTVPLVTHLPQHICAVILIERIVHIKEENPPVLILGMMLNQEPHRVNPPLNYCFQTTAELILPAGILGLCPCHCQHTRC